MEKILLNLIEKHELNLIKYIIQQDARIAKMEFLNEHKFMHELEHLRTQKDAVSDILYDYRKAIEDLRKMFNDWNS